MGDLQTCHGLGFLTLADKASGLHLKKKPTNSIFYLSHTTRKVKAQTLYPQYPQLSVEEDQSGWMVHGFQPGVVRGTVTGRDRSSLAGTREWTGK